MLNDLFTWQFARCAANLSSYLRVVGDAHRLLPHGEKAGRVRLRKPFPCNFLFRRNTSDVGVIREIFVRQSYNVDLPCAPRTILDFGANIGLASLYFACKYPEAAIHAFEPVPDNVALLKSQCASNGLRNVHVHPHGLSDRDQMLTLSMEKAGLYGGLHVVREHESRESSFEVQVRDVWAVLDELGLSTIDLLKIDVEGAEYDILGRLEDRLPEIRCIIGEFHAVDGDVERLWSLLDRLRKTHIVDVEKIFMSNCLLVRAWSRDWIVESRPGWQPICRGLR